MVTSLEGRCVLLIISGGIAAYKSLDLIRKLKERGARVRGLLTHGGAQFVTPLSVASLTGEPVAEGMFGAGDEERFGHIRLSREADLILIAPASADMIAKMSHGMADTLAATVLLASDKPVMIAPAMNSRMWDHPATQANMATLRTRGVHVVGPGCGALACGEDGAGRMAEPAEILAAVSSFFTAPRPLIGRKALVTSGPTFEPIDPVRFIGNRSSGKQGHAIAAALAELGAEVVLVTGPVAQTDPPGVRTIHVETARQMMEACTAEAAGTQALDVAVCAAAVADWRPAEESGHKMKKEAGAPPPALCLVENPDILATLSRPGPARPALVIGFAAETGDLLPRAQEKFARKGCDWLLANDVSNGSIFGSDETALTLMRRADDGAIATQAWGPVSKRAAAEKLAGEIGVFLHAFHEKTDETT